MNGARYYVLCEWLDMTPVNSDAKRRGQLLADIEGRLARTLLFRDGAPLDAPDLMAGLGTMPTEARQIAEASFLLASRNRSSANADEVVAALQLCDGD